VREAATFILPAAEDLQIYSPRQEGENGKRKRKTPLVGFPNQDREGKGGRKPK